VAGTDQLFGFAARNFSGGPDAAGADGFDHVAQSMNQRRERKVSTRRVLEWGGVAAGVILIGFGIAAIVMGVNGRSEVRTSLARENIVGTPDSTIAGQKVDTGSEAKAFADVMREHALEATGGRTYAEMGRFVDANGEETDDEAAAATDPETGEPVANQARNIWVTETALSTALNMSYMAEQLSVFGIVVGVALLLSGIGFIVLALGGALRRGDATATTTKPLAVQ
jgi:hypothetical protein